MVSVRHRSYSNSRNTQAAFAQMGILSNASLLSNWWFCLADGFWPTGGFCPTCFFHKMWLLFIMDLCPNRAYAKHGSVSKNNLSNKGFWPAVGSGTMLCGAPGFCSTWVFVQHAANVSHESLSKWGQMGHRSNQMYCNLKQDYNLLGRGLLLNMSLCPNGTYFCTVLSSRRFLPT